MRGLIIGILLFFFLVLIHELGHFIAAKKSGVKVLEFGIGIPPKICKLRTDTSGTEYTLNLLPLGGFVRLKGEDPKVPEDFNAKDSFIKAKIWKKVIILVAGVTMNFLFAWILFTTVFTLGTKPISILPENAIDIQTQSYLMPTMNFLEENNLISGDIQKSPAIINEVFEKELGEEIGLLSGDIILGIDKENVNSRNIGSILQKRIGNNVHLIIQRNKQVIEKDFTCPEDNCLLGITIATDNTIEVLPIKFPLGTAMIAGWQELRAQTQLTLHTLGKLGKNLVSFNGTKIKNSLNGLAGPAGAIKFGENLLKYEGKKAFLAFAGMISLALALFNILPIPALDGGRLLGVLIQKIGKMKPEKYFNIEGYINLVFFILLMGLGVYILLKDLVRFWDVHIPFIG